MKTSEPKIEISETEAEAEANAYAEKVGENTVVEVQAKEAKVIELFQGIRNLKQYWDYICLIFPLLKDWTSHRYTKIPWSVIASLTGAIVYVLNPFDLIPDIVPVAGYSDDATLFGLVIAFAKDYLEEYKIWKKEN